MSFSACFLQRPGAEPGPGAGQEGRQAGQRKARLQRPQLLQRQGRLQVGGQRLQRRKLLQGQGRLRNRWLQEAPVIVPNLLSPWVEGWVIIPGPLSFCPRSRKWPASESLLRLCRLFYGPGTSSNSAPPPT